MWIELPDDMSEEACSQLRNVLRHAETHRKYNQFQVGDKVMLKRDREAGICSVTRVEIHGSYNDDESVYWDKGIHFTKANGKSDYTSPEYLYKIS